jgi:tellurite resistance protein TerC
VPFAVFTAVLVSLVLLDVVLSGRHPAPMTIRRAALSSALWIGLGLAFGLWLGLRRGQADAFAYFAAYVTEESLSLDNMVVFVAIFSSFAVPGEFQQRVLLWGVMGAIAMRAAAIYAGVALLDRLSWIRYVFGALLIIGSIRLLRSRGATKSSGGSVLKFVGRLVPVTNEYHGSAFFWRTNGRISATPLFVALVAIELSDIVFATDSIPAVFAVTRDPFVVYTSNMLAVLGLRSLYFLVAGVIPRLRYIHYGLTAILAFVGAKMLIADVVDISTGVSLIVIGVAIATSVIASLLPRHKTVIGGL